jgi:hypothetical protein
MLREERADAQENSLYKANIDKGMSNMEATIVAKAQNEKIQREHRLEEAEGDIEKTTEFWSERLDVAAGGEPLTLAIQEGRVKDSRQKKQLEEANKKKRKELIESREAYEYRDFLTSEDDIYEADAVKGLKDLQQKIEDINKSGFSSEEKKKRIAVYESRIASINKKLSGITKDREKNINYKISELAISMNETDSEEEKAEIKRKIDVLESQKEVIFKPIETVTKEITDGKGVEDVPGETPQEKFNNYYDALYQEFADLKKQDKIQSLLGQKGELSQIGSGLRYATGFASDPEVDRFFQLQQKLENFAPVRVLNRYEAEPEEGGILGFGKSLFTSFGNFTTPINRQSDLEKAQDLYSTLKQTGVDIDKGIEVAAKKKEDGFESYGLSDPEFWGSLLGTSAALMSQMMGGGAVFKGTKLAKYLDKGEDVAKILSRRRYLDNLTKSEKIGKLFNNVSTKAISFGKKATSSAVSYEATGIIFEKAEDEANYMSGLYGSVGEQTLMLLFPQARRLTPIFRKMLGDNGFQKFIAATVKKGSTATGRGLGETAEEFMQEVSSIQRESNGDFFEELENRFGTFDEASKFVVSSFVMGAFMGGGEGAGADLQSGAKDALTKLQEQNPEQALKATQAINFINKGSVEALDKSVDETKVKGEYKVGKVNVPYSDIEEMIDAAESVEDLEGITVNNDQELEKRLSDKYNDLSKEVPTVEEVETKEEEAPIEERIEEPVVEETVPLEEEKMAKPSETTEVDEARPEIDEAGDVKPLTEPTDGSTVQLPARIKGGVERTFQFDKGEWKQKVGGELTSISEDLQEELTNKFQEDAISEQVTDEVSVQPEAPISEKVEEEAPKPKPEKPTREEVKAKVSEEAKARERVEEVSEKEVKPKTKEEARKLLKEKFKKKKEVKEEKKPVKEEAKKEKVEAKKKPSKITWKKRKPGKPDSKITERVDPVQESAEKLARGEITNEQYQEVLEANTKRGDITDITEPATQEEVVNAVNEDKKDKVDLDIEEGSQVGVRPDIPSFTKRGTWVNTIHGKGASGKVVSHEGATRVTNPVFKSSPKKALDIATKKLWGKDQKPQVWKEDKYNKEGKLIHKKGDVKVQDKTPAAGRILGGYAKFDGDTHDARMETAKTEIEQVANDPSWTQVSFNPFRGSMYFERSTGRPILGGSEAIVMGSLVYVKDPQYTTKEDPSFEVKGFKDAEGKPVKFQKGQVVRKQNVSTVIDGIIDRTDNKEAKKALNTVKNVVNALSKLAPNQEVIVHETEASYLEAIGEGGKNTIGAVDGEGKIHLNLDRAKSNTILHEATHIVIAAYLKSNPKAITEFKSQLEKIIKEADFEAFKKLKIFELGYLEDGQQTMDEEFVVEALATIANGDIKLSKSSLDKLIELIKNLAKKVGLDPDSIKLTGKEDVVEFAQKLSDAFIDGKPLEIEVFKPLNQQKQGESGDTGSLKLQKAKPIKAKSAKKDTRPFANLVQDIDLKSLNGRKFVTNMYDFTTAGDIDLGNGNVVSLFGGKSYVPYMMHKKGLKLGDVSNLAAFNTRSNAEGFVNNVKQSGADLFMPHSGTLEGSWQFQHSIFEALTNLMLDNKILSKKALINTFNEVLTSAEGRKSFNIFKKRYGKNIENFNSFLSNPKELVKLLGITNNFSPKLRIALNDKIAANKALQEAIGVKNKVDFAKRMMDPLNEGVQGGELMGVIEFDPTSFEIRQTKEGDVDHHPSFGWTVEAKIKGIFQPTEFHQSTGVTDSYTKYNKGGASVSRPTDVTERDYELAKQGKSIDPKTGKLARDKKTGKLKKAKPFEGTLEELQSKKFEASNVLSSAGAIPKVAKVEKLEGVKFQKLQDAAEYIENLNEYGYLEETSASELYDDLQEMGVEIDIQTVNTLRDAVLGIEEKTPSKKKKAFAETIEEDISDKGIEKPVRKAVGKAGEYTPKKMSTTELEAEQIIKDLGIIDADKFFNDKGSNIDEDVRIVLGQKLILNYNSKAIESTDSEQKRGYHNDAIRIANEVSDMHLRMGRANNAAKIYFSLSPEGQLLAIQQTVGKKRKELFKKDAEYINSLEEIVNKANAEVIEEVIKSPKVKKAIEAMYGKASKREGGTSKKSNARKKRIVNQAVDFLESIKIDTSGKAYDATFAIPAAIYNGAISTIQASLKAGLAISEAIDKAVDYINDNNKGAWDEKSFKSDMGVKLNKFTALNKINEGDYAGGVRKGLNELSTNLNEVVRKHYTEQNKTKKALVDKFIDELGLTEPEASSVAKEIEKAFDELATKKKKQELNKLLSPKTIIDPKKRKAKKELQDEIIQMSNMGALDNESIRQSYAEKMGLPTITDTQANEIMRLADIAQQAKGDIAKSKAQKNLLSFQRKMDWANKGWLNINWGKAKEIGTSIWYANMLSGVTTQSINIWANAFETTGEMWISVLQDPRNVSFLMKGLAKGYRKGGIEAIDILRTKYGSVKGGTKLEVPNVLEDVKFHGLKIKGKTVIPNPYNLAKYVGRVMDAADTFFYYGLREARLHQLAAVEARNQGKSEPNKKIFEKASEILFNTEEQKTEATQQTIDEGYKKGTNAFRRRFNEIMDEKVDADLTEDASDFASRGTFNYDPEGSLGVFSNTINSLISKIPVLRAIVPFTRILANVSNKYMDWSPIGALRLVKGGVGWGSYKKEFTKEERKRVALKFLSGTAGMISLLLLDDGEDDDGFFEITSDGYGDYKKNYELSDAKGWQEHSIRIGDTWYSYKNTPLAMPLAMVGYWRDAKRYHGKTDDEMSITTPMAGMIGYTMSFSFMQGVADFMGILSKKGDDGQGMAYGLEKFFVRSSKSLVVPNIVNQTNRLYLEASKQPMKKPEKWYEQYYKDIPYFNDDMGVIYNSFGEEVIPDMSNRLIPFNAKSAQEDKAYKLLQKNGVFGTAPGKTITIDGVKRKLEPKEYSAYGIKSGRMIKKIILEDFDYLNELSPEEFKKEIRSIKSYAREEARYELFIKK